MNCCNTLYLFLSYQNQYQLALQQLTIVNSYTVEYL